MVDEPQRQRRRIALQLVLGDLVADGERVAVHPVLERGGILQRDGDSGIEFFPDPGHREERGRLHLAQIVRHGFRTLGKIHHRSERQRNVVAADPLRDVAERQEHQPLFGVGRRKQVVGVAHLVRHAAIGMHRALGRARGARGVDEDGEIFRTAASDHLVPQRLVALLVVTPERHELGQRQHHRVDKAAEALHVEHDDLLQCRAPRTARQDLVELLLVFCKDHPGRGIIDEIFDLR